MGEHTYCPNCRLREATTADTEIVPQGEHGGLCWARWGSGCPPRPSPVVAVTHGETGEDGCGEPRASVVGEFVECVTGVTIGYARSSCLAPTLRIL